jgi:hypothetical protein
MPNRPRPDHQNRRSVAVVVSTADSSQRPAFEMDRVCRAPIGNGTERRRVGGLALHHLQPEHESVAIRSPPSLEPDGHGELIFAGLLLR